MKIHTLEHDGKRFEIWYDSHLRLWTAAMIISDDRDLGPAIYEPTRGQIIDAIKSGFCKDSHERTVS